MNPYVPSQPMFQALPPGPPPMVNNELGGSYFSSPSPLPLPCKGTAMDKHTALGWITYLTSIDQVHWIEACVLLAAVMGIFLQLLGSYRRRTKNLLIRFPLWASYVSTISMLSYITGLMHTSSSNIGLFPTWLFPIASWLLIPWNISAFSLADIDNRKSFVWTGLVQIFWVSFIMNKFNDPTVSLSLVLVWPLMSTKFDERAAALKYASLSTSDGVAETTRKIADYMIKEHELSDEAEPDPTSMRGYKYLVGVKDAKGKVKLAPSCLLEFDKDKVITLEDIWQCEGLLSSTGEDKDGKLKDICLSFALFWLLLRRYAGYPLHESKLEKTWRFFHDGLLSKGPERAFTVIEGELEFLFDYFYTRYYAIYVSGLRRKFWLLGMIVLYSLIATIILSIHQVVVNDPSLTIDCNLEADLTVTKALIIAMAALEFLQVLTILTSNWSKVSCLCSYVQINKKSSFSCIDGLRQIMTVMICRTATPWAKPWARKLGQYSLLKSYNYVPMRCLKRLLGDMIDFPRNGQKESKSVKLSKEVKEAILSCLLVNGPRLSDGSASLQRNGAAELQWACQLETHTHVILVWHIATSLCEIKAPRKPHDAAYFKVATSLSKYCAYLVALAPGLLPDHPNVTNTIFDQVVGLAVEVLKGTLCNRSKCYQSLISLDTTDAIASGNILQRGALLGLQLLGTEDDNEKQRWKVLADFWAELMVFLAPSENVRAHAEYLAQGGEFITHIWALLTHAGILKRDVSAAP
ncbi:hypothetical protein Ancab_033528 [Ancistrocladus abbreviatus]